MAKQFCDPLEWTEGELGAFQITLKTADRDAYALLGTDTITAKYALGGEDYAVIGSCAINDGDNGVIDLTIDATASLLLAEGKYALQFWVERGSTIKKAFGPSRLIVSKG